MTHVREPRRRKFNQEKFIDDVLNDRYALVIGNEIILDKKVEPTGDVHNYLMRYVNEAFDESYANYYDIAMSKDEHINPVRQLVDSGELSFSHEHVSPELMRLLNTKLFTTVLTTTTDGYLEAAMRKVWGDELRVVNIYDKTTVEDFEKALKSCRREQKYIQPTLIYVFGKMVEDDLDKIYVRTENDAILLIEKWMRMDAESDNLFLRFIRGKRLLALGCKYDNWYFRFFWYVLTGSIASNNYKGTGEVAFILDATEKSDNHLQKFLDRTNICVLGDTTKFISNLTRLFTEDTDNAQLREQIVKARRRGGVFISYKSSNALVASQLFFQLREAGFDVWLDNARLFGGDNYEKEIDDAIAKAKVFLAVLTPQIADDLQNNNTDNFYNKEWRNVSKYEDKKIIPLAVDGYDLRADYHKKFEEIIQRRLTGVNLMEPDGFHKLKISIDN